MTAKEITHKSAGIVIQGCFSITKGLQYVACLQDFRFYSTTTSIKRSQVFHGKLSCFCFARSTLPAKILQPIIF